MKQKLWRDDGESEESYSRNATLVLKRGRGPQRRPAPGRRHSRRAGRDGGSSKRKKHYSEAGGQGAIEDSESTTTDQEDLRRIEVGPGRAIYITPTERSTIGTEIAESSFSRGMCRRSYAANVGPIVHMSAEHAWAVGCTTGRRFKVYTVCLRCLQRRAGRAERA